MALRKPFKAVPIRMGPVYRRKAERSERSTARNWLLGAALIGAVAGTGSVAMAPGGVEEIQAQAKPLAVAMGVMRARSPESGDYWQGCNSARAAGTAPIYFGEPGYREGLDGDGDGIACEPYRGR